MRTNKRWAADIERMKDDLREVSSVERMRRDMDKEVHALTEAIRAIVPVRTGLLSSSGFWESDLTEDEYQAEIRFGLGVHYTVYVMNRNPNEYDALVNAWEPRFEEVLR